MSALIEQLAELERQAAQIKREIASGPCLEFGHDFQFAGGTNLGCGDDCACGGAVYTCTKCGDCDYGDNEENDELRAACTAAYRHMAALEKSDLK